MPTLAEFVALVDDAEKGNLPPHPDGPDGAIRQLMRAVCVGPWTTPDERSGAQRLVYKLERLRVGKG